MSIVVSTVQYHRRRLKLLPKQPLPRPLKLLSLFTIFTAEAEALKPHLALGTQPRIYNLDGFFLGMML
jgi:hypothetical protein